MTKKDNFNLLQHFENLVDVRATFQIKGSMAAEFDYLEYLIHGEFDKNLKTKYKHKKRKTQIDQQYIRAVNTLTREEKINYFERGIKILKSIAEDHEDEFKVADQSPMTIDAYTKSFNLKMWKQKKIRLDRMKHIVYAEKQKKIKHYNLGDFMLRNSKNKDYHCFVLEAINSTPHQKSRTIHIGFSNVQQYMAWHQALQDSIDFKRMQIYRIKMGKQPQMYSRLSISSSAAKKGQNIQKVEFKLNANMQDSQLSSQDEQLHNQDYRQNLSNEKALKKQEIEKQQSDPEDQIQYTIQPGHKTEDFNHPSNTITIINTLIESDNDQEIDQIQIQQKKSSRNQKKHLDLFHKILPDYQFEDLQNEENYETVKTENRLRITQNKENPKKLKIFLSFNQDIDQTLIMNAISDTNYFQTVNPEIQEINIKTMIGSQNSAIIYQKNKSYNKFYRPRDFIYIRHIFKNAQDHYMIDKSIENSNFPPFITIVRGQITILWGILKKGNKTILVIDHEQANQGYLNELQQYNLTFKAMEFLQSLQNKILKDKEKLAQTKLFDLSWDITKNQKNIEDNKIRMVKKNQRMKIKEIEQKQQLASNNEFKKKSPRFIQTNNKAKKIEQNSPKKELKEPDTPIFAKSPVKTISDMDIKGQIDQIQLKQQQMVKKTLQKKIIREFDQNGYVITSKNFITNKYAIKPFCNVPYEFQQIIEDHPIWKGQWRHDEKDGGIIFTNQKKINDQKGVIKFILTKVGKNLLSGKSILNISLPVDIFCGQSNLQRLLFSFTYAPILIEKVVKQSTVNRIKAIAAFGMTTSLLYLNMQKPFNPILGETFQCWINGCPAYAEQISHHPPVAGLYFVGRGYRISTQVESKIDLHMNSGCGINDGIYKVTFQDGCQVCFLTPGGQIFGLAYGDRKFNIVGKAYYWCERERYFVQLVFNPTKKGFFSRGKQQMPSDYFQGILYEVKADFIQNFVTKRKSPTEKDIVKQLGKVSGIWNKSYYFNNEILLDVSKDFPLKLEYEANPLPSDANWREDITYRRMIQISRAQTQKQRLEIFQRNDRKLRQAKHKK